MGVGSEKADTGNYVAYLADQIAKKANVYDIIDQVVTGALDPTQISQKDIANSISKITKKKGGSLCRRPPFFFYMMN